MELGGLGDVVTGGLYSKVFSRPTGHAGEAHPICADCGTQTVGAFCHACGNPSHVHRTLLHLGEELLHGVMHFDGRTWRTLPKLIFRPGQLTREWCLGMRTRYVSPLALFLFTVFVMFMALSYLPNSPQQTFAQAKAQATAAVVREEARAQSAEAALRAATKPDARETAEERVSETRQELKEAREDLAGMDKAEQLGVAGNGWKEQLAARARANTLNIKSASPKFDEKLRHKLENPDLFIYKLQQTFYKFSFLLVPFSIPFVAVLFLWKRGFTLYDHGVFVLYSLTFVSVLAMVAMGLFRLGSGWAAFAVLVIPLVVPVHQYFQLKGAYGLGRFSALWRTAMLAIFCNIVVSLFIVTVIYLGIG